ncbi:MAG: RnfABCDGE type electron transport complex subunit A [Synergistaceae bacterium]|nr:RnfABCDGE type electron transport complex subunit A [Synergistaceae bacterium]
MTFTELLLLFISSIFVHNILLSRFLGCSPFMGVSSKLKTAQGMGAAVVFVIVLASLMTWVTYNYLLVPLHLEYLYTLSFILVIAALVQFVELALKKLNPTLYKSLGIFLPLITTNCAVLGVAVLNMNEGYGLAAALVNALGSSLGFLLAISLMAGIRERIENNDGIPVSLRGLPMALITAGLMSIAFMGFTGLIK